MALKNENSEMTKALTEAQNLLQKQIENFQLKSLKIKQREQFIAAKEKINESGLKIKDQDQNSFENCSHNLRFWEGDYERGEIVKISNPFIIKEFIKFISQRIDEKILKLEAEIIA